MCIRRIMYYVEILVHFRRNWLLYDNGVAIVTGVSPHQNVCTVSRLLCTMPYCRNRRHYFLTSCDISQIDRKKVYFAYDVCKTGYFFIHAPLV